MYEWRVEPLNGEMLSHVCAERGRDISDYDGNKDESSSFDLI